MPNIEDVCARIDANTDRLSTQLRTLAVGLLAFCGGLLVSGVTGTSPSAKLPAWLLHRLFYIGVLAIVTLAIDLAQYCFMYLYLRSLQTSLDSDLRKMKDKDPDLDAGKVERDYDEGDVRFLLARTCFGTKLFVLAAAVVWLVVDASALLAQAGN